MLYLGPIVVRTRRRGIPERTHAYDRSVLLERSRARTSPWSLRDGKGRRLNVVETSEIGDSSMTSHHGRYARKHQCCLKKLHPARGLLQSMVHER